MKISILLFFFFEISPAFLNAQNVSITNEQNVLYVGIHNPLNVSALNIPCASLVLKANRGVIYRSGCQFYFSAEGFGRTHITAYQVSNGDSSKVGEADFMIKYMPTPVFKIALGMSRMPSIIVRNAEYARVEMNDGSSLDYKIQEFTLSILSAKDHTFKTVKNKSAAFSPETKALLGTLMPDDTVIVGLVSALDPLGNSVYIDGRTMTVY
jgi:hypothetical protein